MVIDGDATSVEERLPPGPSQPAPDFSSLQGFQFVGARDGVAADGGTDDEQRRAALALELDARAARFHQAVNSSIVLASDGTIRWLGDSVAKLAPGQDILAPRTILLVDEAMSAEAQTLVVARLELWLNATIQRLLGPLFSLRGLQEGSPQLQDLAVRIANALGVLDREPVRERRPRSRPERQRRAEKAGRPIWLLLSLRAVDAPSGLQGAGAAIVVRSEGRRRA